MNSNAPRSLARSRIVSIALAALVVVLALVFRAPLTAWFTGKSMSDGAGASTSTVSAAIASGTGQDTGAMAESVAYPPAVFDALRSATDAYERVRAELARDSTQKLPEAAHSLAEALHAAAAAAAAPPVNSSAAAAFKAAADHADTLEPSKSIDDARHAFAALNLELLPALAADPRLVVEKQLFECPMFEHARWMQAGDTARNPYMGSKMPSCGTATAWKGAPAAREVVLSGPPGEIDHYTCSMHPSVRQAKPGKCPICGMNLVPVSKEQQSAGVVMIDQGRRQLIGVRTAAVIEGPLRSSFHAVGQVAYDESALTDVNLKVKGWITKLLVNETGQRVARGQTLFTMYSPELYNAEQDFVLASRPGGMDSLQKDTGAPSGASFARAARKRLNLLGLSDAQIDSVAARGEPQESTAIISPASGFVIEKNVVEGASVDAGMRLFRIAALDKVWVEADVYEADLAHIRVGQPAKVTLDYLPGRAYDAKVSYVYPYFEAGARTGRVRIELVNRQLELRPGMYASVELASDLGSRVQVPASAIVYTGPRRLVFVDLGEGRFRPQEVRVGTEADGMYEVLAGLKAGDIVATSGVFLIAAEARISTAAKYWDSGPTGDLDAGALPAMTAPEVGKPPAPMPQMRAAPAAGQKPIARPKTTPGAAPSATMTSPAAPAAGYTCSMHPSVRAAGPGKCPICGMDLVPISGGTKP